MSEQRTQDGVLFSPIEFSADFLSSLGGNLEGSAQSFGRSRFAPLRQLPFGGGEGRGEEGRAGGGRYREGLRGIGVPQRRALSRGEGHGGGGRPGAAARPLLRRDAGRGARGDRRGVGLCADLGQRV